MMQKIYSSCIHMSFSTVCNDAAQICSVRHRFYLVSFSVTTTPSYAGESKKDYIVKKPSGKIEVAVGQLQQQRPGGFFDERKRYRETSTHNMAMPISCGVCAEISADGDIWANQKGYRANIA